MRSCPAGHGGKVSMRTGSVAAAGCLVLLAAVLSGCGQSQTRSVTDVVEPPAGHASGPPTPLTAVQAPLPRTPAREVAQVGLRTGDIPSSQHVGWPAAGQRTSGPLLAFCGPSSAVERHRMARRTVTGSVPHSQIHYADQTVAFDSAATARSALRALRNAAASCAVRAPRAIAPAALPASPSFAEAFAAGRHGVLSVLLVVQQRGDVVDVLTLTSPRTITSRQERLLLREAETTGTRLVRLPLASAGA
jgi:hypothetical protein